MRPTTRVSCTNWPASDRARRGELGASQFLIGHVFKRLELVPVARVPAAVALEALAGGVGCSHLRADGAGDAATDANRAQFVMG